MRIISKNNLCINRPYINLKKLPEKTSLRVTTLTESGFKGTYIINQHTQSLWSNENFILEFSEGIEKISFDTPLLDEKLLVEINYSSRGGKRASKFKVYFILNNIKYALPLGSFDDIYANCMDILTKELAGKEELTYIKECFNSLENDNTSVNIELNLERLKEFKDRVNYKRNIDYFVINNIPASTSKYDINYKGKEILTSDTVKVLRYNYKTRLYSIVKPNERVARIELKETDIICDLSENNFSIVSIYTDYGLGKILDLKNNVIPNNNTLSLFANILDLGLDVLN